MSASVAGLLALGGATAGGFWIGRASNDNAAVTPPPTPTAATVTARSPSRLVGGASERARRLVVQACTLGQRLYQDDEEILEVQDEQLQIIAEAAALDPKWNGLFDDFVFWNAVLKSQISGDYSGRRALEALEGSGVVTKIARRCKEASTR